MRMRMRIRTWMWIGAPLALSLALGATGALADTKQELTTALEQLAGSHEEPTGRAPKLAFSNDNAHVAPKTLADARPFIAGHGAWSEKVVVAEATDRKAAWITANLGEVEIACGSAPCPKNPPPPVASHHATGLAEKVGDDWQWVAWHVAFAVDGQQQAKAAKAGVVPAVIPRAVAGAEDVVKLFESTIGDPKAFAASISSRKDVVLYGSDHAERTVGGAAVRAKLGAWKLAFKVRDGVVAGTTTSKTVAFVAANVDATSQARPKDKPMPYRLLLIYEKTGGAWQVVVAHFSVVT